MFNFDLTFKSFELYLTFKSFKHGLTYKSFKLDLNFKDLKMLFISWTRTVLFHRTDNIIVRLIFE